MALRHAVVEGLRAALSSGAVSDAEALRSLDAAEEAWRALLRHPHPDDHHIHIVTACELQIMRWAHRHGRLLPEERRRATMERVEAREPHGTARRLFEMGTLPAIARFVRQFEVVPKPLAFDWALLPEFQPMVELRLFEQDYKTLAGIGCGERLFVHLGSVVYRGALVIASCDVVTDANAEGPRHFAARVLEFETAEHGPVLRYAEGAGGVLMAGPGNVTIECVIFNRPDVLSGGG